MTTGYFFNGDWQHALYNKISVRHMIHMDMLKVNGTDEMHGNADDARHTPPPSP